MTYTAQQVVTLVIQVLMSGLVGVLSLIGLNFVYRMRTGRLGRWKANLQLEDMKSHVDDKV